MVWSRHSDCIHAFELTQGKVPRGLAARRAEQRVRHGRLLVPELERQPAPGLVPLTDPTSEVAGRARFLAEPRGGVTWGKGEGDRRAQADSHSLVVSCAERFLVKNTFCLIIFSMHDSVKCTCT